MSNLSKSDLTKLRGNDTPQARDISKKYKLQQKQLNLKWEEKNLYVSKYTKNSNEDSPL